MYRAESEGNSNKRRRRHRCSSRRRWRRPRLCRRPPTVGGTIGSLLVCQQLYIFAQLENHTINSILTSEGASGNKLQKGAVHLDSYGFLVSQAVSGTCFHFTRLVLSGRHTTRRRPSRSSNPKHHGPFRKPSIWDCFLLSLELGLGTETHFCCTFCAP